MTVGSELKQARERARLSPEEISERTKIQLYKIDALEKGDFELLPQGIYLDGIVRAYAHEVALDSERMVERVRLERGKLPGDWEVPFAAPIDLHPASSPNEVRVVDVPDAEDALGGFATEGDAAAPPAARDVRHEPDDLHVRHVPYEPYLRDVSDRRQQKPAPEPTYVLDRLRATHMSARPRNRRSNVAVPVALVLLALIGWGGYWYETNRRSGSTGAGGDLSASAVPEQGAANPAAPDAAASSNPAASAPQRRDAPVAFSETAVSPDNDSERRRSSAAASTAPASAVPGDTARGTSGRTPGADNTRTPTQSTSNTRVQDARRPLAPAGRQTVAANPPLTVSPSAKAAAKPAPPARAENTAVTRSVPDVSGSWKLATQVESSSLGRFEGLQLGYEMQLEQNGDRVTGVGRKVTENGGGIGSRAQTPISVNGTVSGDRLTLTFTEGGLQRSTHGKFVLLLEEDGTLRGRFSSNAARSSGRVEAHRVARQ